MRRDGRTQWSYALQLRHAASLSKSRGIAPVSFNEAVVAVIVAIPRGEVLSYGEVAAEAGFPGAARAVGNLLQSSEFDVPWWRVVTANGRLVPGHEKQHAERLRAEGVVVRDGRVPAMRSAARRGRRDPIERQPRSGRESP
jgi:methylated-DNA-protein-cysteine methyltransferase-like protein